MILWPGMNTNKLITPKWIRAMELPQPLFAVITAEMCPLNLH